jgi:methyl-accepting chemotaxis protein
MNDMRKTIMIKREFQQHLMLQTVLMTFFVLNITIVAVFFSSDYLGRGPELFKNLIALLAVLEIVGVAIVYLISKRISFRIAGPVYALERTLRWVGEGDLTPELVLRDGDFFQEAAQTLNTTNSILRDRVVHMQELASRIDSPSPEHAQLVEALAWFKTVPDDSQEEAKTAP